MALAQAFTSGPIVSNDRQTPALLTMERKLNAKNAILTKKQMVIIEFERVKGEEQGWCRGDFCAGILRAEIIRGRAGQLLQFACQIRW